MSSISGLARVNVMRWSGLEARALRLALRMSVRGFAAHLGYNDAAVSNWERRGEQARLRTQTQRDLDAALKLADDDAHERLAELIRAEARDMPGSRHAVSSVPSEVVRLAPGNRFGSIAAALTGYDPSAPGVTAELSTLTGEVTRAKRLYQACRYDALLGKLPGLLAALPGITDTGPSPTKLRTNALAAATYQVACSVLLKGGQTALAVLAADRSMAHAQTAEDPLVVASSARAVAHALLDGGYYPQASRLAVTAAQRLEATGGPWTSETLSLHGSLLLRGALAAAWGDDRATARQLLDMAQASAERLGHDGNAYWTGFGPTNVLLHRVHVAVHLANAGEALDHARLISPRQVRIAERRASLFVDLAHAYMQWGKYDKAYHALCTAENVAPQEVRTRPPVRQLVTELQQRSQGALRGRIQDLAQRIGELG